MATRLSNPSHGLPNALLPKRPTPLDTTAASNAISPAKQVRVFIFSIFRDMHAELDHLVMIVFPELRERVEQL